MNKKRKILTVVAMVVFSAIMLFHYNGWMVIKYQRPWEDVREMPVRSIPGEKSGFGSEVTVLDSWYAPPGSYWAGQQMARVHIKNRGRGWYRDDEIVIRDIHMPLFVLAVFYAGLFAILGDNKRKEQ